MGSVGRQRVQRAVADLPERQRRIIELRFGFDSEPASLETIGKELGLTRERVRQLESDAPARRQLALRGEPASAAVHPPDHHAPADRAMGFCFFNNVVLAARAALASRRQGKYLAFHDALMESKVPLSNQNVFAIAANIGLDVARLKRDMNDPQIATILEHNFALADALHINGTPSFLIGNVLLRGARDLDSMRALVAQARKRG